MTGIRSWIGRAESSALVVRMAKVRNRAPPSSCQMSHIPANIIGARRRRVFAVWGCLPLIISIGGHQAAAMREGGAGKRRNHWGLRQQSPTALPNEAVT